MSSWWSAISPIRNRSRIHFTSMARIRKSPSLEAHRKILQLAKQHQREVWFDVHVWTDGPLPTSSLDGALSYLDALEKLADGARFKVVVFELNANNHSQRRALANALAIQRIERDGRIPVVASANCLQPDGQNDNGWDQGLLFLNPDKTWLQPPGYVTRMISNHHQPLSLPVESNNQALDVCAKRSEDGKTLVVPDRQSGGFRTDRRFQSAKLHTIIVQRRRLRNWPAPWTRPTPRIKRTGWFRSDPRGNTEQAMASRATPSLRIPSPSSRFVEAPSRWWNRCGIQEFSPPLILRSCWRPLKSSLPSRVRHRASARSRRWLHRRWCRPRR